MKIGKMLFWGGLLALATVSALWIHQMNQLTKDLENIDTNFT
jgi:hypothetical protein